MMPPARLLSIVPVAVVVACSGTGRNSDSARVAQRSDSTRNAAVERARAAANALGKDLQTKLFAALDSGGPAKAVGYCADSAQAWTARHAGEGVYVRRVSLRARNAANRPDAAEELQLKALDSLHRAKALPGEIVTSDGTAGNRVVAYVRPIMGQERCLPCHGDPAKFPREVKKLLAERYPADQATGYTAGDLRGMLSVRVRE